MLHQESQSLPLSAHTGACLVLCFSKDGKCQNGVDTSPRFLLIVGDRIFHQSAEIMTGHKLAPQNLPDYKEKIAKVLSEGASGGRVTKHVQ